MLNPASCYALPWVIGAPAQAIPPTKVASVGALAMTGTGVKNAGTFLECRLYNTASGVMEGQSTAAAGWSNPPTNTWWGGFANQTPASGGAFTVGDAYIQIWERLSAGGAGASKATNTVEVI